MPRWPHGWLFHPLTPGTCFSFRRIAVLINALLFFLSFLLPSLSLPLSLCVSVRLSGHRMNVCVLKIRRTFALTTCPPFLVPVGAKIVSRGLKTSNNRNSFYCPNFKRDRIVSGGFFRVSIKLSIKLKKKTVGHECLEQLKKGCCWCPCHMISNKSLIPGSRPRIY